MDIIIAEKPNVARKIASIFRNVKYIRYKNIGYFRSDDIAIISGVGHVYQLDQIDRNWRYPVFDISWKPAYQVDRDLMHTKPYIELAEMLRENANRVIVATDFDIEGSLIGYNIARYALGRDRDILRMKFSSITYSELNRSWNNLIDFDYPNAYAGEARHIVDWYYGINLSRFLMASLRAVKNTGLDILSIGRVQAPSLNLLIQRDDDIDRFIPKDIFSVVATVDDVEFSNDRRFDSKDDAERYISNLSTEGNVELVINEERRYIYPPDLMTLQERAYYIYKIPPNKTLSLAQSLYEKGMISYPRTSSQRYPPDLNIRKILESLNIHKSYIQKIISKDKLIPTSGKKTDPAHPAIYPTGISAEITTDEAKIYDIIVRTFLATLSDPMILEIREYRLDVGDIFTTKSIVIKDQGYLEIFPYTKIDTQEVSIDPGLYEVNYRIRKSKTKPPSRYNQVSILSRLEELKLGTKATRAAIIQTLFSRGYIYQEKGKIYVTELGRVIKNVLYNYVPDLFSESFTRALEEELEKVQEGEQDYRIVINKARDQLEKIFKELEGKEEEIGRELLKNLRSKDSKKVN
ncbi:MAG: DNA topoisomerase I [Candidatus Anstonellales archaeon]